MNLSLVALYGAKPDQLEGVIEECNNLISQSELKEYYNPYTMRQVHGTLIGLEIIVSGKVLYCRNRWYSNKVKKEISVDRIGQVISKHFPIQVRIGGFEPSFCSFLSRDTLPFLRSFQIDEKNSRVVLMGWPHSNGDFSGATLRLFREEMDRECYFLHKYPGDNDFYLVLGEFRNSNAGIGVKTEKIEHMVREYLAFHPIDITLDLNNIVIAGYSDSRLPPASTKIFPTDLKGEQFREIVKWTE